MENVEKDPYETYTAVPGLSLPNITRPQVWTNDFLTILPTLLISLDILI